MILINLLPHRAEARRQRQKAFLAALGLAALAGLAGAALAGLVLQQATEGQRARNAYLGQAITRLELQIREVAQLQEEIDQLKARQQAVENLQAERNLPVRIFEQLMARTPEGVLLSALRMDGERVQLGGLALSNERVSDFLRQLGQGAETLRTPELLEIKLAGTGAAAPAAAASAARRPVEFSLRLQLPPAPGASAPAPAGTPRRSAS